MSLAADRTRPLFFPFGQGVANEKVLDAPAKEGPEVKLDKISFEPGKLIPSALTHYAYEGSLTTPPCTEGVNFYILKTPVDISKAQVAKFPFKMNARPVQPLNGRKIGAN